MYSCARLAQTFLCVLESAFLQSLEQYETLLQEMQGLSEGLSESDDDSGLEHFAQVGVGASGAVLGPVCVLVLRRGSFVVIEEGDWLTLLGIGHGGSSCALLRQLFGLFED